MSESWNVGRTEKDFQCLRLLINGLFGLTYVWQQRSAGGGSTRRQKGRREAGLSLVR
jgi:hypothetical protein